MGLANDPVTVSGRRWLGVCFGGVVVITLLVLLSWATRTWRLATMSRSHVPTAPGTAGCLLALAVAAWWTQHLPSSRRLVLFARVVAASVIAVALMVLGEAWLGLPIPFVRPLHRMPSVDGIPLGRMSPLTAVALLIAAVILWLEAGQARRRASRQAAALLTVILLFLALGVALSHALDVPLFYSSHVIPMAAPTAVAFVLLGLGMLTAAGADTWPMVVLNDPLPRIISQGRFQSGILVLSLLLLGGITAAAWAYLRHEHGVARRAAAESVATVADAQVRQLAQWHRERRADGAAILTAPVHDEIGAFMREPEDAGRRALLNRWLDTLRRVYGYSQVLLVDMEGRARLSSPENGPPPAADMIEDCRRALRQDAVVIHDLHRPTSAHAPPHLGFIVPLGGSGSEAGLALLLLIDARRDVFPLLDRWPTRSASGETLLFRREGDEVVMMYEGRAAGGTASTRRLPVDGLSAAALAVRGSRGEIEAADYRGVPVVAALRAVPDTPWFIIAKVDQKEVYVTFRRQLSRTALLLGVLLLAVVLGVSLLWYRHGLVAAERELLLQARLRRILDADIVGAVIADYDGRVIEANDYYLRLIGVTREEFQSQPVDWRALTPPEWAGADEVALRELRERGTCTPYEKEYIRSDGTRVPVLLVDAVLPGSERHIAAFVLDLTERKTIEAELESLARQRQLALDAAGMGWWTYDSASQNCSFDERSAEIFGLSAPEGQIDAILQRVHDDDRPRLRAALRDALDPRHPRPYSIEYRIRADDGSVRWVEAHGAATGQEQGSMRLVGTLQDITERKRAEVALAERIEELRRWHEATLGRENRILEIKQEVNDLLARAGQPPRYASPRIRTEREEPTESGEQLRG